MSSYTHLYRKLTLFCTCITQIIIIVLSFLCIFIAEKNIKQGNFSSFLTESNSIVVHLQEQTAISHQWLNQLQENSDVRIYLFDNGNPLFYDLYHHTKEDDLIYESALSVCPFTEKNKKLTAHTEFTFSSADGTQYYASIGNIPKGGGYLSFLIVRSLTGQQQQFLFLRLVVFLLNAVSCLFLFFFFYHFVKKILEPAETARKKQTQFIASASHELRTPLAVLCGGFESIEKSRSKEEQQHFLRLMSDETMRMKKLIDEMLLLANSDAHTLTVTLETVQPDTLLLDTYEKFEPLARQKGIAFSICLPEELLPDCICDIDRMEQIFSILTDNAICYTPAGGSITLSLILKESHFLFSFSDTGCGISDTQKPYIFERFYRADDAHTNREHFGLGLCIAKELIQKQHGSITVTDTPAGGSCFLVTLPCSK